jgi:hypothetical protein
MTRPLDRERAAVALVLGGVAVLLCDVRFEHREALGETWRASIPLFWGAATLLAGSFALWRWAAWRRLLAATFAAGVVVGLLGFWFHSGGHPLHALTDALAAWRIPFGNDGGIKPGSRPPALAPLAMCGLGSLGLLFCTR